MAADDVAKALMAMDDEGVRAAVAGGDLAGIDVAGLDLEERRLVIAAATDDPDTEGFGFFCNMSPTVGSNGITCNGLIGGGAFGVALNYTKDSQVPGYKSFQQAKLAQGSSW